MLRKSTIALLSLAAFAAAAPSVASARSSVTISIGSGGYGYPGYGYSGYGYNGYDNRYYNGHRYYSRSEAIAHKRWLKRQRRAQEARRRHGYQDHYGYGGRNDRYDDYGYRDGRR